MKLGVSKLPATNELPTIKGLAAQETLLLKQLQGIASRKRPHGRNQGTSKLH